MLDSLRNNTARRARYALVLGAALLVGCVFWLARGALLPYVLALVLIYLLLPPVNILDRRLGPLLGRRRLARGLAIAIVYLAALAVVALFVSMIVPVLNQQFGALWNLRGTMAGRAQDLARESLTWYRANVSSDIQAQVDENVRRLGNSLGSGLQGVVTRSLYFITNTFGLILGFIVIPFWMFYVMYDQKHITGALAGLVPMRYREDAANIWRLIDTVLSAYIRGQLLLCVTIGAMATVGLTLLHVPFPLVLGVFAGLVEFIPYIGPVMGAIPAVLVALIQSPILALWTILLYLGIQQVENVLLAPRISGNAVALHPAVIMLVLVIGNEIWGLGGMLIAVPVTAILRDVFRYLYLRWQDTPCTPAEALAELEKA